MLKIWYYLFGKDEYIKGEHVAHYPSLWKRLKKKRKNKVRLYKHQQEMMKNIPKTVIIEVPIGIGKCNTKEN